jgi:hypothetical protein
MRATKGLWAALGAGTSLAAAGVLALFSVSVVLAVRGWPQVRTAGPDSVALRAEAASAPTGVAAGSATGAAQVVVARARPTRRHAAPGARGGNGGSRKTGRASAPAGSQEQQPASTTAPVPFSAQPQSSSGGAPPAQAPQVAGNTIKDVTAGVGEAVRPISPPVADTITKTGDQAGGVVEQVGNTVGGLVGGLTGGNQP